MKAINRFGTGDIFTMDEIIQRESMITGMATIYAMSTACMSVTSDMQSWASARMSKNVTFTEVNKPGHNNVIIVLGCQVTDLAILNDIMMVERLHAENPNASVYVGGCLAYRFDIQLPEYANRLTATRAIYQPITANGKKAVHWAAPFWVEKGEFEHNTGDFDPGRLFRNCYPLKIGAGCNNKCKYCTIRDTRGEGYEADAYLQVKEFIENPNVVLISDSPTAKQLNDWCDIALRYKKTFSIRNVEPFVAMQCMDKLMEVAEAKLLKVLHCPIQSNDKKLLSIMGRNPDVTTEFIIQAQKLRQLGVKVATNIIIDYTVKNNDGSSEFFSNMPTEFLDKNFDYWSWNPYFDGHWDRKKAEERWKKYIDM